MREARQRPTITDRVTAAMTDQNVWMAAERDERRRQLRHRPDRGWQEVAVTIATARQPKR